MFRRLLLFLAIFGTAASLQAQKITGKALAEFTTSASAQYYNLSFQGVKSFSCNADVDWDSVFKQFNGSALPADNPLMMYLAKSRLGVKETITSGAEVSWANSGTPPEQFADSASKLRGGIKQMLEGFFASWTPNVSGKIFSSAETSVTATPTGYHVAEKNADNDTDTLTFDKSMLLSHISSSSPQVQAEVDMKYLPNPQGLLVTSIEGDYRQPATAPPTHVTMSTDYQTVEGFQLPNQILASVRNVGTFNMKLSGCTIEKQSK